MFCRVRPLLPDDGPGTDMVVSYPTSTEALGRGIELLQSGKGTSFFPPSLILLTIVSRSLCACANIIISSFNDKQGRSTLLHLTRYLITRLLSKMFSLRYRSWYKVRLMGTRWLLICLLFVRHGNRAGWGWVLAPQFPTLTSQHIPSLYSTG